MKIWNRLRRPAGGMFILVYFLAACTTNPMATGMSSYKVQGYTSSYEKKVALGHSFAMEADENFAAAFNKTLASFDLAAEDPENSEYVLDVEFQELDTEQDGHDVTATAEVKYTLYTRADDRVVVTDTVVSNGSSYATTDRSLAAEAGIKAGLGLLMVGMLALGGIGGHSGDTVNGLAQTPGLELSTERAHRTAKEEAISNNITEFFKRIGTVAAQ